MREQRTSFIRIVSCTIQKQFIRFSDVNLSYFNNIYACSSLYEMCSLFKPGICTIYKDSSGIMREI